MDPRTENGMFKYVRVGDEIRFSEGGMYDEHRKLLKEGEVAKSAGSVGTFVFPGGSCPSYWKFYSRESMTLKVYAAEDDEVLITKFLGLPRMKESWEA